MRSISAALTASLVLAALGPATAEAALPAGGRSPQATARAVPTLHVRRQVTGLDHPWDVQPIGHGRLLFTQRDRATLSVWEDGHTRTVDFPSKQVWVSGETGLMSLAIDPKFARNGRIYTCQGGNTPGGGHEVHVIAWRLNDAATKARRIKELVGGFPTSSGRHGGCRLLITRDGSMLVGTGDAAVGTNPENLESLGGKTLRLNRTTGSPWPTNPFIDARNRKKRYIQTYGHRNVQGLAQRADGSLWSIEQGTYRDDEVNRLVDGGDYGYNPVPGYNEDVPMTDQSLPGDQVEARWSSGDPTLATSGGTFVRGAQWGSLRGALAVAALKASRIVFLSFDSAGHLTKSRAPKALQRYGRLRSVTVAPDDDLLVTTDNGNGGDAILRVSPR
ncbi:PQQ-dependent sugar dehydrogenase [Nocardioides ungokensis]|uniref:PQQ-dependent sugar dehydrogenase n=1 Tax=Nocardioides ungokensis TaxID=1643322 RepID=UPI0015DE86A0|nr:PQQ-dependent sugar dehydrogenase [Nocardioides ungokensis]